VVAFHAHLDVVGGVLCLIAAWCFAKALPALRKDVHPIYVKIGVLPNVASGIHQTTELTLPPET
jgi:hypothetical protein